jgi:hypothetical protein
MLDDSFFDTNGFYPPDELKDTFMTTSYPRNGSRTTGAYLISQAAAQKMLEDQTFIPAYGTIDFQLDSALKRSQILTHWVIPPLSCAGSEGILDGSETGGAFVSSSARINCRDCCNRYYDASDNWSPFQTLELVETNE